MLLLQSYVPYHCQLGKFLINFWQLFDNFLKNFWRLPFKDFKLANKNWQMSLLFERELDSASDLIEHLKRKRRSESCQKLFKYFANGITKINFSRVVRAIYKPS